MSTKVTFRRAEVWLPRRPQAVLPRSQVLVKREKGDIRGRLINIYIHHVFSKGNTQAFRLWH